MKLIGAGAEADCAAADGCGAACGWAAGTWVSPRTSAGTSVVVGATVVVVTSWLQSNESSEPTAADAVLAQLDLDDDDLTEDDLTLRRGLLEGLGLDVEERGGVVTARDDEVVAVVDRLVVVRDQRGLARVADQVGGDRGACDLDGPAPPHHLVVDLG